MFDVRCSTFDVQHKQMIGALSGEEIRAFIPMLPTISASSLGSACVPRVGFGVAPKQSFEKVTASPQDSTHSEKSAIARRARQHARRMRYPESHLNALALSS